MSHVRGDPQEHPPEAQRPPAEVRFAGELARLRQADTAPRPPGWQLSPRAVRDFILGDEGRGIERKFVGERAQVERLVVGLLGSRGLLIAGEPGTAKSMLSELLAAAISHDSTLVVQGSAGTTDEHLRYSWNYALLLARGPSLAALVPSALFRAMRDGKLARLEEVTRCAAEVQDVLISILSDKVMVVPELDGEAGMLYAAPGFSVIATANTRDRGVNEMSAALKRRFNFEVVRPLADPHEEAALILRESAKLCEAAGVPAATDAGLAQVLATLFEELRGGRTAEGATLTRPTSPLSTAEAVALFATAALGSYHFEQRPLSAADLVAQLAGTAVKDAEEDGACLRSYFETVVKSRAMTDARWAAFFEARSLLGA